MTTLTIASLASAAPMGQQVFEREVTARAAGILGPSWQVRQTVVRSLRSPLPGTARMPARLLHQAPAGVRRAAGAALYPRRGLVHRMDLRLPPATVESVSLHDVVSWRFPDEATPPRTVVAEVRRAAAVICASAFSAQEIVDTLGVREPIVIPNGVDPRFAAATPLDERELTEFGIRRPFVLHAGGCTLRKNLPALAAAWPLVRQRHRDAMLVLIGPPDRRRDGLFADQPGTALLGRVADEVVPRLMAAAAAVVVPSLYEGFGLPALEAMAAGSPVVASNRSSLPEVCADAALLVEPTASGLADGLECALAGGADVDELVRRGRARAAGFSWEASGRRYAEIWRNLAPESPRVK